MKPTAVIVSAAFWTLLALPTPLCAQEVALTGTVTDSTEAVLPGVTVTAVHVDTGNTFVGVTDAEGMYRIGALRTGMYSVTAALDGFATMRRELLELLVGQRAVVNFRLTISSIREAITVTSESPLVDVTRSELGGNIDSRQFQALPLNGRNWLELTTIAPGSRVNAATDAPLGNIAGSFQMNVDGQQVSNTQTFASIGQPRFSRDAIAEFELLSSRFDATQGRSRGNQVNAVTKAGTNTFAGTVSGYFQTIASTRRTSS